ncbi:MAG: bifunctional 4-hydroxy-2-oxoglutarate aldolase/2-dehydro-3-deoxy-phosphogluconate aldolase [Abitibacteriaceae bacterium]|nr:bifunctional 4-hydroxy-2-oxoglutarate aldolase/2-dehydro-3-deoxy-phosphogluconate aldolase [Abditibacteriaceae bacterium]
MDKLSVVKAIQTCGVVAVVRADSGDEAINATRALMRGGVRGIEITFTVPGAAQTIVALAREATAGNLEGDILLGAGTVLNIEQAEAALDAGAQFLVSPCIVTEVIHAAQARGIAMLPGALTPTEIWTAHALGGDIIKVFPASRFGPSYFKDIKGPLPHIPLLPTGGVDAQNAGEWLKVGAVALGVGGKLVDREAIKAGDWDLLTTRARELMQAVRAARGEER